MILHILLFDVEVKGNYETAKLKAWEALFCFWKNPFIVIRGVSIKMNFIRNILNDLKFSNSTPIYVTSNILHKNLSYF